MELINVKGDEAFEGYDVDPGSPFGSTVKFKEFVIKSKDIESPHDLLFETGNDPVQLKLLNLRSKNNEEYKNPMIAFKVGKVYGWFRYAPGWLEVRLTIPTNLQQIFDVLFYMELLAHQTFRKVKVLTPVTHGVKQVLLEREYAEDNKRPKHYLQDIPIRKPSVKQL